MDDGEERVTLLPSETADPEVVAMGRRRERRRSWCKEKKAFSENPACCLHLAPDDALLSLSNISPEEQREEDVVFSPFSSPSKRK